MVQWQDILVIANIISYTHEDDRLIWKYETNGGYFSKSLYAIVNFRGIQPIYLPAVWKLKIPQESRCFSGCLLRTR
jgi:hypothetical protein